jgi:hypothetical protein
LLERSEQSKKEEQAIADIIRGVRAFNPINEEETIDDTKRIHIITLSELVINLWTLAWGKK